MVGDNVVCTFFNNREHVTCNGTLYMLPEEKLTPDVPMFWVYLGMYIFLMLFAGLMSGLTMGLLSLGSTQLEILEKAGKPIEKKYAKRIFPIVKRHHLLLVTLLLANAAAVETMPIFMDRITNPIIAIVVSVSAVLLFGEIIPQALCTRYGLAIGYYLSPVVYFLMFLLFIIAWPISKLLDCMLGTSHGVFFRRAELKELVNMHQNKNEEENEEPLSKDEAMIIKGALDLSNKVAQTAYVKLDSVFMLPIETKLDMDVMDTINEKGHSRIPVYKDTRENIIGVILVKSIIAADPEEAVPITNYMRAVNFMQYHYEDEPLYDILDECQKGKCHLSFVKNRETDKITGIITLEDVIEEILQQEIIDETDVYEDVAKRIRVARASFVRMTSKNREVNPDEVLIRSSEHFQAGGHDERTPLIP